VAFEVRPTEDPLVWALDEEFADRAAFEAHQARTGASDWARETAGITRDYRTWEA
jgi:quinol monooxygenase YgiN